MLIYGPKTPTLVHKIPQPFGGQVNISTNKINIANDINIRFRRSTCHLTRATTSTNSSSSSRSRSRSILLATAGLLAAAAVIASASASAAMESPENSETLSNIPQTLSGECALPTDCKKARIQRPKSRKAESCTIKCVTTCIRGGDGSPGEGPFNVRRPLVVFKQGFRSRQYCLVECSDICNLIKDGDDGP
ncbi:PREDICTED: uncharacterized protein LOC103343169 [Prunus mume]|uniref:Uncharacterized protein LOC103343169 n=1 Tax=Prunus mume TaxID=102107 RepID=A0ABM0PVC5_PRUMU|nr:PREDICTED: uncharacterized protein LOC103343169 [Prunus mume]